MQFNKMYDKTNVTGVSNLFCAYGSFGIEDGDNCEKLVQKENGYTVDFNDFSVNMEFSKEDNVYIRKDFVTFKSEQTLNHYASRFVLEGGEYEVYTQYNAWQHESSGCWQKLVTTVEVCNNGIRSTEDATPMVALRNLGNNKIYVFHLVPNALWKISVRKAHTVSKYDSVVLEFGINNKGLNMKCEKDETIEMPTIIAYEAKNIADLDGWKVQHWFNTNHPRKELPIIYNTWMMNFDTIDIDRIKRQADTAAEIGIEQFLIDAGWFGITEFWEDNIGNWEENTKGGFYGRMKEVSDYVRSKGIKFGLWLEPERALVNAEAVKNHPEYFIKGSQDNYFVDFSNDEAFDYIYSVTSGLIEKYNIEYMKFDFNANVAYDVSGNCFYKYYKGQKKFIHKLRENYPNLYLTNCASGGIRLDLAAMALFDSCWISDNQSPYHGTRIIADTILRMPRCVIESYDVRLFADGFPEYKSKTPVKRALSCDGATWSSVINVEDSFTFAFLTGGPMGFSADIDAYPEEEKKALKELVTKYKQEREFYKKALARILYRTEDIFAMQYSSPDMKKNVVQLYIRYTHQDKVTIYPAVDTNKNYVLNGIKISGEELLENGIIHSCEDRDNTCTMYEIIES